MGVERQELRCWLVAKSKRRVEIANGARAPCQQQRGPRSTRKGPRRGTVLRMVERRSGGDLAEAYRGMLLQLLHRTAVQS